MKRTGPRVSRRVFLRGTGTVAIGLPLVAAVERYGLAQESLVPERYITLYYGNGLPKHFADMGYDGPLSPLSSFADKMAMVRGLHVPLYVPDGELHWRSTSRFGVGITADTNTGAAGQSLDAAIHARQGGGTRLLNMTMHGRADGNINSRAVHSWNKPKIPNNYATTPYELFHSIFGESEESVLARTGDEDAVAAARVHNSVLDSVIEQYRHIKSDNSPYSAGVRAQIADHLDLVRSLERRSAGASGGGAGSIPYCEQTPPPEPSADLAPIQFCSAQSCPDDDKPLLFIDDDTANWNTVWPLMAELYATALRCGSSRFGTVGCTASGDRYPIPELPDVQTSVHDLAHQWRRDADNGFAGAVEWLMQKVALFLTHLDDPAYPDPNGGTVLDNTLVFIGTELGTSGDGQHGVSSMTYFLAGAQGLVRTGIHDAPGRNDVDLYSSIVRAMGIGTRFGEPRDFRDYVDVFNV